MLKTVSEYAAEKPKLIGMLAEFREALEDEIHEIEASGQSSTLLSNGKRIQHAGTDFWYSFRVEYLPALPADTPCTLVIGSDTYDVSVIGTEESAIFLSSKIELPDTLAKARLDNGSTVLMKRLINRIEMNAEKINHAGERMLCTEDQNIMNGFKRIADNEEVELEPNITDQQKTAVKNALINDITYIWGPPGTGKTKVIGEIISELIKRDRSVLLVSHTNTAVDGAIKKVDEKYYNHHKERNNEEPYPILRFGIPKEKLENRVMLEFHIAVLGKELYAKKNELNVQYTEYQRCLGSIVPLIYKANWLIENHLAEVAYLLDDVDRLDEETIRLCKEQVEIGKKLKTAKANHAQYSEYETLQKKLEQKEQITQDVQCRISQIEANLIDYSIAIRNAKDELVKHEKYAELKAKEAKQLSNFAQKQQISQCNSRIKELQSQEKARTVEFSRNAETISDYNKKGALKKLFAGKNGFVQATERNIAIEKEIPEIQSQILVKITTLQIYNNQLIESLSVQDQLRTLTLSNSKDELRAQIAKLSVRIEKINEGLPGLKGQKAQYEEELTTLRISYNVSRIALEEVNSIQQELITVETSIAEKQFLINKQRKKCSDQLESELDFCSNFDFSCLDSDIHAVYLALGEMLKKAKQDLINVDVSALKEEEQSIHEAIAAIQKELAAINQKLLELEKQAIMQAKVIGTTLTKSYLSDVLQERTFDTVILDEASMASIPALWCASILSDKNIVIVGDFKQLPPIVMAETTMSKKWLGSDIFSRSGMKARLGEGKTPPENFITLNEQFRMEEEIADIANMYYEEEGLKLKSQDLLKKRIEEREEFHRWYSWDCDKPCVQMIDTKSLHAWVTGVPQGKGHSRLNCFSATLCVDLAFQLIENKLKACLSAAIVPEKEPLVLIVSPYKPHTEKLKQLIEFAYKIRGLPNDLNMVHAGTIHSFQGKEAEIVIFDLVIDEPHWKANLFMPNEEINSDLKKMFNVAITRAKFKLFIVGNFEYCQKHAKNNALGDLLHRLMVKKKCDIQDAKALFPSLLYTRPDVYMSDFDSTTPYLLCKEDGFFDYFRKDIKDCEEQMIIFSPFISQDRLSNLLPDLVDAIKKGCRIIVVTKALSDRSGKNEIAHYRRCEKEMRDNGICIIHKKGMHEKNIFIDQAIVWQGSLNVLSFSGLTGEIMQRFNDKKIYNAYMNLYDINHLIEVANNEEMHKCPICEEEMIAAESNDGGFYWTCVKKDYSRNPSQPYPLDGIFRCSKCGALHKFSMKNRPRWVCVDNSSHYQYIRESDLNLEKMLFLILRISL